MFSISDEFTLFIFQEILLDFYKSDEKIQLKQIKGKESIDLGTDMEFSGGDLEFTD